jgi:hypothetical protein
VREVHFRRGFVEAVKCTARAFITHGGRWAEAAPLREATLTTAADRAGPLADCRHLRGLAALTISDRRFDDEQVETLARSLHLRLAALTIRDATYIVNYRGNHIYDRGLRALGAAAFLPRLERLHVSLAGVGPGGLLGLLGPGRTALRSLSLVRAGLGDAGAVDPAGAPGLGGVRELALEDCAVEDAGLHALLGRF